MAPERLVAATEMMLLQLPGEWPETFSLSLPHGHDDGRTAADGVVDGGLGRRGAGAVAAEAHVDDLGDIGVGGHAGDGAAGRPGDGVDDVGVVAAALAEDAHRGDLRAVRDARDALAVVRDRGDGAGDVRAVPGGAGGGDARAALVGRVVVAGVGRVAVTAVAVDGDRGVGDEVVAADDVRREVGVGDVAGVDDGDGDTAAGRSRPGARHVHAGRGLVEVPLLGVLGVVRVGLRLVEAVRHDVGDLWVRLELGHGVGDFGLAGVRAQVDEGGPGAESALEVGVLGRGVGLGGLVRRGLGGARLVADDEALGLDAGSGLGERGRDGGLLGGGVLGDGDGGRSDGEKRRGDGGGGYQLPPQGGGGTQGACLSGPCSGQRGAAVESLRR